MKSLREVIFEARDTHCAIGHFNVSNIEGVWAVVAVARRLNVPVIIGLSEGERAFFGPRQAVAVVRSIREEFNFPVYTNADHTYSFEKIKEAIDAGFDMVIADGAKLPIEENIAFTKKSVEYARATQPGVLVEGELGYIGTSSKILDQLPVGAAIQPETMTHPEEAKRFVTETGVDLFAPAVGNIHGIVRNVPMPRLNPARVKEIAEAVNVPLVLHGGSGTREADFKAVIAAGISMVHINTELRLAFRKGLEQSLKEHPEEIAPYKFMQGAVLSMEQIVEEHLRVFSGM